VPLLKTAHNDAMQYCQAAITKLEQMKLLPAVDAERIAAMKAGIPRIDVYKEYTGERPMKKGVSGAIPSRGMDII